MASFAQRVVAIRQQQQQMRDHAFNSSIASAGDFLRRYDGIKQQQAGRLEVMRNSGYNPDALALPGLDSVDSIANSAASAISNRPGPGASSSGSGSYASSSGLSSASAPAPAQPDYYWADLANKYEMSKETAYQEALSNTAYQRAVKDMQAAGLNPASIYGSGHGQTADGVSYIASPRARGGSGGGYSRRSGGKASSGKLFSSGAYGAISAAAGLVAIAVTKRPDSFWIGSQTAQGVMGAMNELFKR